MPLTLKNFYKTSRLPSEYQEVEYIWTDSVAWQYINTWIQATNTITIELDITPNTSYVSENSVLWTYWSWNAIFLMEYSWKYRIHNGWTYTDWPTITATKTSLKINNLWLYVNWSLTSCASQGNYWGNAWINLFTITATAWFTSKTWVFNCYETKISDNWVLVRDLIPCYRKLDSVIWMYDIVNNVFYTNQWWWSFIKWPDVN